jgi:hypothetical protein
MDRNCLKYFIENRSTNIIQEERVKEDIQLKNYLMFKSMIPEFDLPKTKQKLARAIRLTTKNISK